MRQYSGTEAQMRLQQKADEYSDWMYSTVGACHPGRFLGTDNPDQLGWDVILGHLEVDGAFGFRLIPAQDLDAIEARLENKGYRIDFWDVFIGRDKDLLEATRQIEEMKLPIGISELSFDNFKNPETIREVQEFMIANGIAPFSGKMLSGGSAKSCLTVLVNSTAKIVATSFGYLPHNIHSPNAMNAWGGLVAVHKSERGNGLGVVVNAKMVRKCVEHIGATRVHELVSESNITSRKMVERCGLKLDASVKCGIATVGNSRFTT